MLYMCVCKLRDQFSAFHCRFVERPLSEWLLEFEGCHLVYGPVNNFEQVFSDPQVRDQVSCLNVLLSAVQSLTLFV